MQVLEQLDLSFNNLKGEVLTEGIFKNKATSVLIDGNQGLCGGLLEFHLLACPIMRLDSSKNNKLSILLKVVIPSVVALLVMVVISVLSFRRRKQKTNDISLPSFGGEFPKISHRDLARATEGFATSNLIGQGRYSSVY